MKDSQIVSRPKRRVAGTRHCFPTMNFVSVGCIGRGFEVETVESLVEALLPEAFIRVLRLVVRAGVDRLGGSSSVSISSLLFDGRVDEGGCCGVGSCLESIPHGARHFDGLPQPKPRLNVMPLRLLTVLGPWAEAVSNLPCVSGQPWSLIEPLSSLGRLSIKTASVDSDSLVSSADQQRNVRRMVMSE